MKQTYFRCVNGYSFIELLVAVAILGLVTAPLLAMFTGSFSSIAGAGRKSAAINLCREKIEILKAGGYEEVYDSYLVSGGFMIEDDIPGWPGYSRVTEVKDLAPGSDYLPAGSKLLSVKVTVYWQGGTYETSESLESRLAKR